MPLKEKFIIPQSSPRNVRHTMPCRATPGSTRAGGRSKREGSQTVLRIPGKVKQNSVNSLGSASLNNFRPWGRGTILLAWHQVLGWFREGKYCLIPRSGRSPKNRSTSISLNSLGQDTRVYFPEQGLTRTLSWSCRRLPVSVTADPP